MGDIKLVPLEQDDKEQFIKDNQWAFKDDLKQCNRLSIEAF